MRQILRSPSAVSEGGFCLVCAVPLSRLPNSFIQQVNNMDERVARLTTTADCQQFAANAIEQGFPELAEQCRRRGVQLRAEKHGAGTPAEHECLEAIYAYEEVLSRHKGRRVMASRTWQMIKRHGILAAVERIVTRPEDASGYTVLVDMGLDDLAFEAVILRHPGAFSKEAIEHSVRRLAARKSSISSA
jgi:hypothetical protein